jgi:hippurate hydrolase
MGMLLDEARDLLPDAVRLRRRLHRRPELGLHLPATQDAVLDAIDGLGLAVTLGERCSSVVAVLEGAEPGPTVLLRGDMDALPMPEDTGLDYASEVDGAMHACGHDAHTAMLAGAARLLAGRQADLAGRVVFMFQPGEEGYHGARVMIEDGLLDQPVDLAFAIHQSPVIPSGIITIKRGPLLASSDVVRITVTGRGGHASMPHQALDPIPVACAIVQGIQTMVTRRLDVFDPAVVTIARISSGSTSNVIPERADIEGTIRAVSARTRALVRSEIQRVAEGLAAAHGAEVSVEVVDGYPVTVNHDAAADEVVIVARNVLGDGAVVTMPNPVMGAEDFSYVLERAPGAMAFLGTRPGGVPPAQVAPNHSNRMVIDESAMAAGIALYAAVALGRLTPGVS